MASASGALALLVLASAAQAEAQPQPQPQPHPRAERGGGVASVGIGTQYAGIGLQLLYLQPVPLAPFGMPLSLFASGAFGNHATLDGRYALDGTDQYLTGVSFMVGASAGRVHRACLGAGWGAQAGHGVPIEGLVVGSVSEYGPYLEAGYELLARNGVFARVLPLGLSYLPRTRFRAGGELGYTFSLGLGWKPW